MKDLKTRLTERIVEWDPVDLVSVTDKNEYNHEIDMILSRVTHDMNTQQIAGVIRDVFIEQFRDVL